MPRELRDEYGHGLLTSERTPENQVVCVVDPQGYVVRAHLDPNPGPMAFFGVLREAGKRYRGEPLEIVMPPDWPVDQDGRGLSIQEVLHQQRLTNREKAA